MHIVPNGCGCDPAMIQPSRQSLENVETPGPDFSRAAKNENQIGRQLLLGRTLSEKLCPERILDRKKAQELKPRPRCG
jgi:hypothetical protein